MCSSDLIQIGERTSVQDGSVLHVTDEFNTVVGNDCVIGHLVHLEGCTIDDECLIGVGSILLHRVRVHSGSIVAANSTLLNDTVVPSGALAVGTPATIKEGKARVEQVRAGARNYVERTAFYKSTFRRLDPQ